MPLEISRERMLFEMAEAMRLARGGQYSAGYDLLRLARLEATEPKVIAGYEDLLRRYEERWALVP